MKVNLWINNEEISTTQYMDVYDPGRLTERVGQVAQGTSTHVDQAVKVAHEAFRSWRKTPLSDRISLINKAADLLEDLVDQLSVITSKENGMLISRSKGEIRGASRGMRNLAELAHSLDDVKELEDKTGGLRITKKPLGVIGGIIPWNAPFTLAMQKLAPALLTGNTIVFKPSPFASMGITIALQKLAQLFPPGVINVVLGDGEVGEALTTHPLVRKISFTGGGETAKRIMKSVADSLKRVHFELGGNDPALILDDAPLDVVIPKIVEGALGRSGQYCYAIKRVYVPEKFYDQAFELACQCVNTYKIGHQLDERATMGPINNKQQFDRLKVLIQRTIDSGAHVKELGIKLHPEEWENGYYLRPVVAGYIQKDAEIVTCEQFGPIIPLIAYRTETELIEMANETEYGLGSTVWSSDLDHAFQVARQVEAGMTFINMCHPTPLAHKYMPFGGIKQSGIGWENSEAVFDEYLTYHSINYHHL